MAGCGSPSLLVDLRKVDLALELQILSFYQQRRDGGPTVEEQPAATAG